MEVIIPPPPPPPLTQVPVSEFLKQANSRLNAPYIWGGKGSKIWTPKGMLINPWRSPVFDCSGLVTDSLMAAAEALGITFKQGDLRGQFNAQNLHDLAIIDTSKPVAGRLRFYGSSPAFITHVAIVLERRQGATTDTYILDASGGDARTREPTPNAHVRIHQDQRKTLMKEGWLPILKP